MTQVTISPLLLDALALAGTSAQSFLADAMALLADRPRGWRADPAWLTSADGRVRVTMLKLADRRVDALVNVGRTILVSDTDRVAVTVASTSGTIALGAVGRPLSSVCDVPVLTAPGYVVLSAHSIAGTHATMLTVAAPAVTIPW